MSEYRNDLDLEKLEPHYTKHVGAMTSESLHSKSSIAAQLAYRDLQIERLTDEIRQRDTVLRDIIKQESK